MEDVARIDYLVKDYCDGPSSKLIYNSNTDNWTQDTTGETYNASHIRDYLGYGWITPIIVIDTIIEF